MPDHLGDDMRKIKDEVVEEKEIKGKIRGPTLLRVNLIILVKLTQILAKLLQLSTKLTLSCSKPM